MADEGGKHWHAKVAAKIAAEGLTVHVWGNVEGSYDDAIATKKSGGALIGLGPWLPNLEAEVPETIEAARRMQLFVPCWRDFARFALLVNGYGLTPSGGSIELAEETDRYLAQPRANGVLPIRADDLLAIQRIMFMLQRKVKWEDGLSLQNIADASMLVATARNHVLQLAAKTKRVLRRPHDRTTKWPQPRLAPGATLEIDIVAGIDPVRLRVMKAISDEVDVPWIPYVHWDSGTNEAGQEQRGLDAPATPSAPRRDGLTTVLQFEPRTRYELSVALPSQVALTPWHSLRLSDELIRAGIVLEASAPVMDPPETPVLRLYLRSRRMRTRVAVSAGAILGYLTCTYQPVRR